MWEGAARGVLFILLLVGPLLFSRWTPEPFESNKAGLLQLSAILLTALGLSHAASAGASGRLPLQGFFSSIRSALGEPVTLGVVLLVFSGVVSTAWSLSPRSSFWGMPESEGGLTTLAAYAVVFFAVRWLYPVSRDAWPLLAASVAGGAGAAAYAVVQVVGLDPVRWERVSAVGAFVRPFGTMAHPNVLAAYLAMALPAAIWLAGRSWVAGRLVRAGVLASAAAVMVFCIAVCLSRGGWLASGSAVLVLALGWRRARRRPGRASLARLEVGVVILVAVALAVALTGFGLWEAVAHRVPWRGDVGGRPFIWRAAVAVFREHWWTGCGLDTFQLAFPKYRTPGFWQVEWGATPAKAHNEILHVLATQGLLGGLAVLLLGVGLVRGAVRAWRKAGGERTGFVASLSAAALAFGVQGLFGFTTASTGTLFAVLAGLLSRGSESEDDSGEGQRGNVPGWGWVAGGVLGTGATLHALGGAGVTSLVVAGAALLALFAARGSGAGSGLVGLRRAMFPGWARVAAWTGIWSAAAALVVAGVFNPVRQRVGYRTGAEALGLRPAEGLRLMEEALARGVETDDGWVRVAQAAVAAGEARSDGERQALLERGRRALARATELVPANSFHHANLGKALAGLGRGSEAFREMEVALGLDPNNAYHYADAGEAAFSLGDLLRAAAYARRGLGRYPTFGPLRALAGRVALREGRYAEAAGDLASACGAEWHGDSSGLATALSALARAELKLGFRREAEAAARAARSVCPDEADARRLAAELEQPSTPR